MEFKIGDRVRVKDTHSEQEYRGLVFTTTSFERHGATGFYSGDPNEWGVWEKDLDLAESTTFDQNVHRILNGIADTVSSKNLAYGDSALNPVRIFSKADRMEQLFVRLDDKLSRVQRGHEYPGDDTIRDIIGYCTLILIARESE